MTPEEAEENREKENEVAVMKVIRPPKQNRGRGRPRKQPSTVPWLTPILTASLPEKPGPSGIQLPATSLKAAAEPEQVHLVRLSRPRIVTSKDIGLPPMPDFMASVRQPGILMYHGRRAIALFQSLERCS